MESTGIVLCGGKSKRMGYNKALLKLGELTLIEHVIESLKPICKTILISTTHCDLDFLPYKKVADQIKDLGPIAGFYSTLQESKTENNIVVSCDTPFISSSLLSYLLKESTGFEIVLPVFKNHLQPMTGYFRKSILPFIQEQIKQSNYTPVNIFEKCKLNAVEINKSQKFYNKHLLFNINKHEDYIEACKIYNKTFAV